MSDIKRFLYEKSNCIGCEKKQDVCEHIKCQTNIKLKLKINTKKKDQFLKIKFKKLFLLYGFL